MTQTIVLTGPAVDPDRPDAEGRTQNGQTPMHTAVLRLSPTGLTCVLGIAHRDELLAAVRLSEPDLAQLVADGVEVRRQLARRQRQQDRRRGLAAIPRRACAGCGVDIGRGHVRWCADCRAEARAARRSAYSARRYARLRAAEGKTVDPVRSARIRAGLAAAKARRDVIERHRRARDGATHR